MYAPAGQSSERADGVLEIRYFLCLRRLAQVSALGSEADQRRCGTVGDFIGDNVDTLRCLLRLANILSKTHVRRSAYLVPRNGNHRILGTEVQANDTHVARFVLG